MGEDRSARVAEGRRGSCRAEGVAGATRPRHKAASRVFEGGDVTALRFLDGFCGRGRRVPAGVGVVEKGEGCPDPEWGPSHIAGPIAANGEPAWNLMLLVVGSRPAPSARHDFQRLPAASSGTTNVPDHRDACRQIARGPPECTVPPGGNVL